MTYSETTQIAITHNCIKTYILHTLDPIFAKTFQNSIANDSQKFLENGVLVYTVWFFCFSCEFEILENKQKSNRTMNKRLMNVNELSEYTGLSTSTFYTWVNQRRIPFLKCERLTKFDLEEIDKWIKERCAKEKKFY